MTKVFFSLKVNEDVHTLYITFFLLICIFRNVVGLASCFLSLFEIIGAYVFIMYIVYVHNAYVYRVVFVLQNFKSDKGD